MKTGEATAAMYICNISFIVVSRDGHIGSIIENTPLPPRTNVSVLTCAGLGDEINAADTIVVFDGEAAYEKERHLVRENAISVLLTKGFELPKDMPHHLWLAPTDDHIRYFAARAIEEHRKAFDYRRLKICFETAFDSIPDLVWFKDVKGSHLWVNDSFCGAVGKTKDMVFDRGHYYIWDIPKEEYDQGEYVCLESEDVVMKEGRTCLFDEKVKTKNGMKQFQTYKSPLYDVDGTLFGTCGVAGDVTSLHNVKCEVDAILETMPFSVLVEDDLGKVVSVSSHFFEHFPEYENRPEDWVREVVKDKCEISVTKKDGSPVILTVFKKNIYSVFHDVVGRLIILTDVTDERESYDRILSNANTDFLTGLYNRRHMDEYLKTLLEDPSDLAFIYVDLDNFKNINDTLGHNAGDNVLIRTAKTLCNCFDKDFIVRMGGDEFLIISKRHGDTAFFESEAQRLIQKLHEVFENADMPLCLSASAGVAVADPSVRKTPAYLEKLIRKSDGALYRAKHDGKNCVRTEH